jgi:hypothetical protein
MAMYQSIAILVLIKSFDIHNRSLMIAVVGMIMMIVTDHGATGINVFQ